MERGRQCKWTIKITAEWWVIMTKLTVADIADEILKAFDLDDARGGLAMEQLHNRVKAQEADPDMATKMLNEGFLAALASPTRKNCASSHA